MSHTLETTIVQACDENTGSWSGSTTGLWKYVC